MFVPKGHKEPQPHAKGCNVDVVYQLGISVWEEPIYQTTHYPTYAISSYATSELQNFKES